jgi:hypothetical protein
VYADWQEEHGQPAHAELIRLFIERDRLIQELPDDDEAAIPEPIWEKIKSIQSRLDRLKRRVQLQNHMGDGFGHLYVNVTKRQAAAKEDYTNWFPGSSMAFEYDKILTAKLEFNRYADERLLIQLGEQHWVWRTVVIDLTGSVLGPGALSGLVRRHQMPGLYGSYFRGGSVDVEDLSEFFERCSATEFHYLSLTDVVLTRGSTRRPDRDALVEFLRRLAASPVAAHIRHVGVETPQLTDAAIRVLLDRDSFKNLKPLDIPGSNRRISAAVRREIAERFE